VSIQKSINLALLLLASVLLVSSFLLTSIVRAQDTEDNSVEVTTTEEAETQESEEQSSASYEYVAQSGDSYSLMARKAVQTYGLETSTNLSGAQIIFAETNLTKLAGSPLMTLGQNVSIDRAAVQEWVENAQELSDAQEQAWEVYVRGANFNTDNVGESRE
jgi:hypothetical protein